MTPQKKAKKPARAGTAKKSAVFTAEERAAMKEYVRERNAERRPGGQVDGEAEVLAKIAKMPERDRSLATRLHALVKANAPSLSSKTWYGMPAYARDGKVVCFFQDAQKFKSRYATLGFSDQARLDDGEFWPTSFAIMEMTPATERRIAELIRKAVGEG